MSEERLLRRDGGSSGAELSGADTSPSQAASTRLDAFKAAKGDFVDLFVYGTLLNDRHVQMLVNRKVESVPAVLHNYMKVVPPGAFYFIVKQRGAKTQGRILKRLSKEELARIDAFEDEGRLYYRRVVVARSLVDGSRQRCMTYLGEISALQKSFGQELLFEDRYGIYLDKKIDEIIDRIEPERRHLMRRAIRELMGAQVDSIIESHFDGNYICNYIMIQALTEAKAPSLAKALENPELRPYAGNYMRFACKHIVFNQISEIVRRRFPDAVRVSRKYFRHGLAALLSFLYCNRKAEEIAKAMGEAGLDKIVEGRLYRDYAALSIQLVEEIYREDEMRELIAYVDSNWSSSPTSIGAELEFSYLGARAVNATPGEDPVYDSFYWFDDFDLQRRTWRLGGHVDAHRDITPGQGRHRGFFEYALGRFNIVGDLSRPLFDCPWAMSLIINEAVKFLEIPPHSLHISLELPGGRANLADAPHTEADLVCLLLLGGDLRKGPDGRLREWRVFNNELDTNMRRSLNFSDRKRHYSLPEQDPAGAAEVMEYKFLRLRKERCDYSRVIIALKGYQRFTRARPVGIGAPGSDELPEHAFLRSWAAHPQALDPLEIDNFTAKVERGLMEEFNSRSLDKRRRDALGAIHAELLERNHYVARAQS